MSTTIANDTASRKAPPEAFYGFLMNEHGIFTTLEGLAVFMASETEEFRVVEAGMSVMRLGEVGLADTQQIMDRLHGGAAAIACERAQEVA